MDQPTYNEGNLPSTFLTPPMPALHPHAKPNWKRQWSVYWIATHWDGKHKSKYNVLAAWVAGIEKKPRLTRQRIEAMVSRTHWVLRDYTPFQYEKIDMNPKAGKSK